MQILCSAPNAKLSKVKKLIASSCCLFAPRNAALRAMAEQEQEQAPPPTSPERAGTAFNNTDQPSSLEQPLTPVHSSGCLLDTAFALCGVSVGSVGGGGSTCSSGSAERNTRTEENNNKKNMSRSSGSGEMNGSNNTNNTNANNLTGSVAGMSLLDNKDASAKADNGDGSRQYKRLCKRYR